MSKVVLSSCGELSLVSNFVTQGRSGGIKDCSSHMV